MGECERKRERERERGKKSNEDSVHKGRSAVALVLPSLSRGAKGIRRSANGHGAVIPEAAAAAAAGKRKRERERRERGPQEEGNTSRLL